MVAISLIAASSLTSCGSSSASSPKKGTDKKSVDSSISVSVDDIKTWEIDSTVNDMGEKNIFATVAAKDLVELDFPYNGGSTGKILIRRKNGNLGAMFTIDKGQIDTDYDGTYIRVKFDDEAPVKWSMSTAADNSSDILFFDSESKFYNKLKKSKKVVLEIPFYQNGNKQFVFNTEGLPL